MARELSAVLDHAAKMGELSLDDVAPTSHVVEMTGALRPDRRARRCRARSRSTRPRTPATRAFSSPARRPSAPAMSDEILDLSATAAIAQIEAGELSAEELFAFYRERAQRARGRRRGRRSELPDVGRRGSRRGARRRPTGRWRACRWRSRTCSARRACRASRARASSRAIEPPYTATAVAAADGRRGDAAGEGQPGRVRDGLLQRELGVRRGAEPVGPRARARAAPRAAARRRWRRAWRRGRWARTPAARCASRRRCAGSSG